MARRLRIQYPDARYHVINRGNLRHDIFAIHLNPVRARVVPADRIAEFNASSLAQWLRGTAPDWLYASELLRETGVEHGAKPWPLYVEHLIRVATAGGDDERVTRGALSVGWAIGTAGWRKAIAREHRHLALLPEMSAAEIADLKSARWLHALDTALTACGKCQADLENAPKGTEWKVAVARTLRSTVAPSYRWLANQLHMGKPASVRVYLSRGN